MSIADRIGEETCDLCRHKGAIVLAEASQTRNRTVACSRCRFIYAWPRPTVEELERHYREEFRGDPGSEQRVLSQPDRPDIAAEEDRARSWSLQVVKRVVDVQDKHVLDLRSRTGALAAEMQQLGAIVTPVDPFPANISHAKSARGLSRSICLPMSQFHTLPFPEESFDVITALTEHVPGHVMCAAAFFDDLFRLLKPHAYLLMDEKDVLRPRRFKMPTILDTGPGHLYHFTQHTLRLYLQRAGFDVSECEIDRRRTSASRHIRVVAWKPATRAVTATDDSCWDEGPTIQDIHRQIWWSKQRWRMRRFRHTMLGRHNRRAA